MDVTNVFKIEFFKTNVQLFYLTKIDLLRVSYFHCYCLPIKKEDTVNKQKVSIAWYETKLKKEIKINNNRKKPQTKQAKEKKMLLIKIEVNNIYILLKSMRIYLIVHIRRWYKYDMIE